MEPNSINAAIDNYNILSETQKKILKLLVGFDQAVPVDIIMKLTGLSKQALHRSMGKLLEQNIISREKIRIFVYKVNDNKILEIINLYNQQVAFKKK